jgi:hypothetical protein
MGSELVLLGSVKAIFGIIEKIRSLYKDIRKNKKEHHQEAKSISKELLDEVSLLIDNFTEICDVIVLTLTDDSASSHARAGQVKVLQANRRLFELSSEMRILISSLESRFPQADISTIESLKDVCFQIVIVEDYLAIHLLPTDDLTMLRDDVSPRAIASVYNRFVPHGPPYVLT